uniref:Uncharacterized protein n=1 Tax=Steinernema glaseri TaxID=37863 RepID=A0A1I8AP69_9BILA
MRGNTSNILRKAGPLLLIPRPEKTHIRQTELGSLYGSVLGVEKASGSTALTFNLPSPAPSCALPRPLVLGALRGSIGGEELFQNTPSIPGFFSGNGRRSFESAPRKPLRRRWETVPRARAFPETRLGASDTISIGRIATFGRARPEGSEVPRARRYRFRGSTPPGSVRGLFRRAAMGYPGTWPLTQAGVL